MGAKLNYIILGVSLAVGVVLRTFMLLFMIEPHSGFIKHQYITPAVLVIVFIIIAAALVFFTALNHKGNLKFSALPLVKAISGIIMALAIFYEAFASSLLKYATPTQNLLHKAAAVLSVAAFLYMAYCYFAKINCKKPVVVAPIVFWITRVITVFTEFASLATVSDSVIETATMCLCLIVFLNSAKQECELEIKAGLNRAVALLCGFTGLVSALPRIICSIITPTAFGYFSNIPPFTSLAAAIFAVVFALSIQTEE